MKAIIFWMPKLQVTLRQLAFELELLMLPGGALIALLGWFRRHWPAGGGR